VGLKLAVLADQLVCVQGIGSERRRHSIED
jgi:hypothetical protein